jgi:hypothetical protein
MSHKLRGELGLNFITGGLYILTQLIVMAFVGMLVGMEIDNGSLQALGKGVGTYDYKLVLITILTFSITGLLIYGFAHLRKHISKHFGLETKPAPVVQTKRKLALFVTFLLVGILTSIIFYGFNQFISGLSPNNNINSLNSLWDALVAGKPVLIIAIFLTITAFGYIVGYLGKAIHPVQEKMPDVIKEAP